MESSSAQMSCVFKVKIHCDGCKRKVMEVLRNLKGVYSVVIDPEKGTVKINGKVNPCIILNIFDKYGEHGELSSLRFDGQVCEPKPFYYCNGQNFPYNYDIIFPQYPIPGGPQQHCHGRNQNLPPPPPLPLGLATPPLLPPLPPPPQPINRNPTVQPAPPSKLPAASSKFENPICCSTM